ncbi:MAG: hypothetical protein ACR2P1_23650 [Pseudomonadales bacterium]
MNIQSACVVFAALVSSVSVSAEDSQSLRDELQKLKSDYQQRIEQLDKRLQEIEATQAEAKRNEVKANQQAATSSQRQVTDNAFNPALSLILDGSFASYQNEPEDYELPGFPLGGEAGLGDDGFAIGETELAISTNIDDKFYGKLTVAIAEEDGETELELEEAYFQTLGLGHGITVRGGRFFSAVGYLNEQHAHAWDFADAPLIYRGLFGDQLIDDGVQLRFIAPTDLFLELGAEALRGSRFPAGGEHSGAGAWSLFAHVGGDIGYSHSWQLGLSHWSADVEDRGVEGGGLSFDGDSEINALDFVYKWAPNGNATQRNFKFQFEYFDRNEDGEVTVEDADPVQLARFDGSQQGWYAQAIYQFVPQWRAGVRYDSLQNDNTSALPSDALGEEDFEPKRYSTMLEWVPSEFSRIRLQYNHDKSYAETDNQWLLQYTFSLGAHGAHAF